MIEQRSVVKETLMIHEWSLNFIDLFYLLAFIEGVQENSAERQKWFNTIQNKHYPGNVTNMNPAGQQFSLRVKAKTEKSTNE